MEKWRKPVKIHAVEQESGILRIHENSGRIFAETNVTISEEDTQRVRQGYVCIRCFEPHEYSFPENCALCGYEMRDKQTHDFAHEFKGNKRIGPQTSIADEIALMKEEEARKLWKPGSSILLPGSR